MQQDFLELMVYQKEEEWKTRVVNKKQNFTTHLGPTMFLMLITPIIPSMP